MASEKVVLDCERNVIGSLLLDCEKIKECTLEGKHFLDKRNGMIYDCIVQCYEQNGAVDVILLTEKFDYIQTQLDYIFVIMNNIVTSSHFDYYVNIIKENYISRTKKNIYAQYINNKIDSDEVDYQVKLVEDEFQVRTFSSMKSKEEIYEMCTMIEENIDFGRLKNLQENVNFIKNVVYTIGARPSVGKTALALNIMNDLSDRYNCVFFNMEMKESELYQRLVSINSGVPIDEFKCLTEKTMKRVLHGIDVLLEKNIQISNGAKSTKGIRQILKAICRDKEKHTVVFIDHIGYVYINGKDYLDDKSRIGNSMKELQAMTKEFNCTMFILSQINRSGSDEPKVEYLKDSGQIEEVSHGILLLHDENRDFNDQNPTYKLIVAKNRSGKKGKYNLPFHKDNQTMDDIYELDF